MSELLMIEQRPGDGDSAPWILDRHGRRMRSYDDSRRTCEVRRGLARHPRVRSIPADADPREVKRVIGLLHDAEYLRMLSAVDWDEPTLMPKWSPPELLADSPVWAGIVSSAFEGARTAITAAQRVLAGERYAYAVCRPPGHHAGPDWMGGYCYLNNAAAAAHTLCEGGLEPVAILDLDFHFPNGTSAIVEHMSGVSLCSLHASTLENVPWREITPNDGERFVEFELAPDAATYLGALELMVSETARSGRALVLSLGYDTIAADPHGTWLFTSEIFHAIGGVLAACALPVCVVQEGGYALAELAACSHSFASGLLNGGGE
ncbi:MAG TPA: hypothetical protein VIC05_01775 [Solirubrobacteraceae bacterium]|jgi:acetoin utilization deacetylase AcuC-like enzyme